MECEDCGGKGTQLCFAGEHNDLGYDGMVRRIRTCPACKGKGFVPDKEERASMALGRILSTLETFCPEGEDAVADLIRSIAVEGLSK
jgi:hypothetical protein